VALTSITPPVNTVNGKVVINFAGGGTNFSWASTRGLEKQKVGKSNRSTYRKMFIGGRGKGCFFWGYIVDRQALIPTINISPICCYDKPYITKYGSFYE